MEAVRVDGSYVLKDSHSVAFPLIYSVTDFNVHCLIALLPSHPAAKYCFSRHMCMSETQGSTVQRSQSDRPQLAF